jgi:hypothetical protein
LLPQKEMKQMTAKQITQRNTKGTMELLAEKYDEIIANSKPKEEIKEEVKQNRKTK